MSTALMMKLEVVAAVEVECCIDCNGSLPDEQASNWWMGRSMCGGWRGLS